MRQRVVWLTGIILVSLVMNPPTLAQDVVNLLDNGGFEDGVMTPWTTYGGVTATVVQDDPVEGQYCLHLDVPAPGANNWDIGLQHQNHVFEQGKYYTVSAFLRCAQGTLDLRLKPELQVDPWTAYGEQVFTINEEWAEYSTTTPVIAADVDPASITFHIGFAAAEFWIDYVRFYEGDYVPPVFIKQTAAVNPTPLDAAGDIPQDAMLSWQPGEFAAMHDVYFGMNFDDVNAATVADPLGVLVSQGQTDTVYDPEGLLEFGQTYYWRVDEVNAAPDSTVFKGPVWSFTVEPYSYPVPGTNITATASSEHTVDMGPEKTIDGSGLNAADQHGSIGTDMWLSATSPGGAWIQYEFDQPLMLDQMWVWNSNQLVESIIGFGCHDVVVEFSIDGETWTVLEDVTQFAQAPGMDNDAPNNIIDLGGLMAKYVRITATSNYGSVPQYGLSEVRFYYAPTQARAPQPANNASNAGPDLILRWRGGRRAAAHQVLFSDKRDEVLDGTAVAAVVSENWYDPGPLNLGTYYYWAVNEVNEASGLNVAGDLWSFSTPEALVLDDFESYDDACNRIFFTWLDGWGHNGGENIDNCDVPPYDGNFTGSLVGNDQAPFAERSVVNSGRQAMPLDFDNSLDPYYSEATSMDWALPSDWTRGAGENLTVALRGNPADFVENADGTITMSGAGADIYNTTDEFRFAYKQLNGDGSITARIDSLTDVDDWAKAGVMIREGLDAGNLQAHMILSPRERTEWMYRDQILGNTVGPATDVGTTPFPHWVRLTRTGNTIVGEHSVDGVTWTRLTPDEPSTADLDFIPPVYIGLVVTSHVPGTPALAEFSNVTVTGATGPWQVEAVGVEQPSNDAAPVYLTVKDGAGHDQTIVHPDPAATQVADWQTWTIPLTEFDLLDLSNIKSVTLGVGDRINPQAGGTGKLYVDDLQIRTPLPEPPAPVGTPTNILDNGDFEAGVTDPWSTYGDASIAVFQDDVAEGNYSLLVTVNTAGPDPWSAGLQHAGHVLTAGKSYTLSARLKSLSGPRDVTLNAELGVDPWTKYAVSTVTLTGDWAEYTVSTGVIDADVDPATITFHIAAQAGQFLVDDVMFTEDAPAGAGAGSAVVFDFETDTQGWAGAKDGIAPTVVSDTAGVGSQSLRVTIDEGNNDQQEGGWASPRTFSADEAAGGLTRLAFWYRVDDPDFDGGDFVLHWISSTEAWSGGGWYGNGLWGVVVADGQWHQQTADLTTLGAAAGGWEGVWGDQTAWAFRDDLYYSFEIVVAPTDNTTGSDIYIDDVTFE